MQAISLFSGVGGFEIGFERAGIETVLQVESDPVCRSVLERHWPDVERLHDVRDIGSRADGDSWLRTDNGRWHGARSAADLIYGGFPCQDVSVAGQRAGLSGERSGLWHEFHRVLRELRPRWCVIENVPGLLSSGAEPGADFGVVLRGLVDLGYGVAWRVLDARWFGVPQRRRRVFLVGCLGDAQRAAQVLAVCESCGGNSQARGEEREDIAPTLDDGARRASVELPMIAVTLSAGGHPESNMPGRHKEDDVNLIVQPEARAVRARASGYRMDFETENFLVAGPVRASDGHHGHSSGRGDGADNLIAGFYTHRDQNHDTAYTEDGSPPILSTQQAPGITSAAGVRRLTPLECERLQGFPDGWTEHDADGKPIPDSHRYRMLGNAVATVCAEWIGHRLMFVESL